MQYLGLFIFRVLIGLIMFVGHGWGKLTKIGTSQMEQFADPIGLGTKFSFISAALVEGVLSLFIVLGLFTRVSSFLMAFTMLVAGFMVHKYDPFFAQRLSAVDGFMVTLSPSKELAVIYMISFGLLAFTGPGKYSVDNFFMKSRNK